MKQNRDKVRHVIEEQLTQLSQINMGSKYAVEEISQIITRELEKNNLVRIDWEGEEHKIMNQSWKEIMQNLIRPDQSPFNSHRNGENEE